MDCDNFVIDISLSTRAIVALKCKPIYVTANLFKFLEEQFNGQLMIFKLTGMTFNIIS